VQISETLYSKIKMSFFPGEYIWQLLRLFVYTVCSHANVWRFRC